MTLMSMNFLNRVRGVPVPSINEFRRVTLLAGALMAEHLRMGDSAVDATAGTGADTCLLARVWERAERSTLLTSRKKP